MWIQFGKKKNNIFKHNHIMQKKILITFAIVAAIAIPIGIYTISPLFISATVIEPLPATTTNITAEKPLSGIFTGVHDGFHNAEGIVKVVSLTDGNKILRLEDFKSTNGPNVHVYLSTDKRATDYVDLGKLKANNGDQNYNIPAGTDI